jgi:ABC-type multidrug transport system ATPase subunit/Ca2+-binding EF-hand superfamily protein
VLNLLTRKALFLEVPKIMPVLPIPDVDDDDTYTVKKCNYSHGRYTSLDENFTSVEHFLGKYHPSNYSFDNETYCEDGYACGPEDQCGPCMVGQYCPNGTVQKNGYVMYNLCPQGMVCEFPNVTEVCPEGFACGIASPKTGTDISPSCGDYEDEAGVFCPEGSVLNGSFSFKNICKKGSHCPQGNNGTLMQACPPGTYCYEGAMLPQKCTPGLFLPEKNFLFRGACTEFNMEHPGRDYSQSLQFVFVLLCGALIVKLGRFLHMSWRYRYRMKTQMNMIDCAKKALIKYLDLIPKHGMKKGTTLRDLSVSLKMKGMYTMVEDKTIGYLFALLDANSSGRIGKKELGHWLAEERLNAQGSKKKQINFERNTWNSSSDVEIELTNLDMHGLQSRLDDIWDQFDSDRSGYLSKDQFRRWYKLFIMGLPPEALDKPEVQLQGFKEKQEDKRFSFRFDRLGLRIKGTNKRVLNGVSGEFDHSQLIAVMGPSGAGKSTFLNTLCGRAFYGEKFGKVFINGKEDSIENHGEMVGFVPQDDTVFETLTVYENFFYSAALRLPDATDSERDLIIEDVISLLELSHIRDSVVGSVDKRGISGGQRKRVNIGLELVADPSILFLDEPTSGLDSTSAKIVMSALKDLANLGMTVISVIHQPRYSIFALFDQLLLLGKGGMTVFCGPTHFVQAYFEGIGFHCPQAENLADFLMDCCAGVVSREGDPTFVPEDLFVMWRKEGSKMFAENKQQMKTETVSRGAEAEIVRRLQDSVLLPGQIATFQRSLAVYHRAVLGNENMLHIPDINTVIRLVEDDNILPRKQIKQLEAFLGTLAERRYALEEVVNLLVEFNRAKIGQAERKRRVAIKRNETAASAIRNHMTRCTTNDKLPSKKWALSMEQLPSLKIITNSSGCYAAFGVYWKTFFRQFKWLQVRIAVITYMRMFTIFQDLCVLGLSAAMSGWLSQSDDFGMNILPTSLTLAVALLGVLVGVNSVALFGAMRLLYYRERGWGLQALPYFLARALLDIALIAIKGFAFGTVFYDCSQPLVSRSEVILVFVGVAYAASPVGYIISITVAKESAVVSTAAACFLLGGLMTGLSPTLKSIGTYPFPIPQVYSVSFGRWAVEGIFSKWMNNAPMLQREAAVSAYGVEEKGYRIGTNTLFSNAWNLFWIGTALRALTLALLIIVNRDKQNKQPLVKNSKLKGRSCLKTERRKLIAEQNLRKRAATMTSRTTTNKNRFSEITYQDGARTPAMRQLMRTHTGINSVSPMSIKGRAVGLDKTKGIEILPALVEEDQCDV